MKAAVLRGVQELVVDTVPQPTPHVGEVVVRLHAAALNHRDVWIKGGKYAGLKFPVILGSDGAGTVVQAGPGVDPSVVGQEVILNPSLDWGILRNPRTPGSPFWGCLGMAPLPSSFLFPPRS